MENVTQFRGAKKVLRKSDPLQPHTVAEFAVDAGVKEMDLLERVRVTAIRKAAVVWFGVDVNADGTLAELGQVQDLMDRLFQLDLGGEAFG